MASNYQNELRSGQHRYAALAQSLLHDIESGRYPVGSLLPTEIELVEQFGLSRHTVREAIRQLQQVGLVTRRKGVGTRVKLLQQRRARIRRGSQSPVQGRRSRP